MRALASFGCGLGLMIATTIAAAEPTPQERALATELFQQGRALMSEQRFSEACPKLAESMRLVPGGGTLLNLAICHEGEGKTATAWGELNTALGMARRDKRRDRIELADERLRKLEPKLSRLTIEVADQADSADLEVRQDGVTIGRAAWGSELPVDPGEHRIEALAKGKQPFRTTVTISSSADRQVVRVPKLDQAPHPTQAKSAKNVGAEPSHRGEPGKTSTGPNGLAIGLGVTGLIGVGVGTAFGLRAMSKKDDYESDCVEGCSQKGADALDQAKTSADISTVGFAVGAVALGLATYFWIAQKPAPRNGSAQTLSLRF